MIKYPLYLLECASENVTITIDTIGSRKGFWSWRLGESECLCIHGKLSLNEEDSPPMENILRLVSTGRKRGASRIGFLEIRCITSSYLAFLPLTKPSVHSSDFLPSKVS